MSIYSSAVEAYRDTTKWLAAFVPVTALATAGILLGPRVIAGIGQDGPGTWLAANWLVALALLVVVVAVAGILWSAAAVLSVEPEDLADLLSKEATSAGIARLFGGGALLPDFFDKAEFHALMQRRQSPAGTPGPDAQTTTELTEQENAQLANAVALLREWSVFDQVQRAFRRFVRVFLAALVALGAGGVVALTSFGGTAVEAPTAVEVDLSPAGTKALRDATGCTGPVTFVAIGGTLTSPVLDPAGAGCRFGATWHPRGSEAEIRYPGS